MTWIADLTGVKTVRFDGETVATRAKLNFLGDGVTVADNAGSGQTDVTVLSGGTAVYVTDLTALAGTVDRARVYCDGYYARYDGGGGTFVWHAGSSTTANGGTVLGAGTGRWKRVYSGAINVRWFGAKGDGSTNDTAAINAAAVAANGGELLFPAGATFVMAGVTIASSTRGTVVRAKGATLKSAVLGAGVGTPIFSVTGTGKIVFEGGYWDGARASQPADGFSDAYDTGPGYTGRAYRCAIKADGVGEVIVKGAFFTALYGAGVACRDVDRVSLVDCEVRDSNFELGFLHRTLYSNAPSMTLAHISGCRVTSIGSGEPYVAGVSVNADGFVINGYLTAKVDNLVAEDTERCAVKLENCGRVVTNGVQHDTNSMDSYPAIQVAIGTGLTTSMVAISDLSCRNVGQGISFTGLGTIGIANLNGVTVDGTLGPTTGDGIQIACSRINRLTVNGVHVKDAYRKGLYCVGRMEETLKVSSSVFEGSGSSIGIDLEASTANWGSVEIDECTVSGFAESASGEGLIALRRASSYTFARLVCRNNTVLAGGAANRGIRCSVDAITAGVIADNYVDGEIEFASAGVEFREGNIATGAVYGNLLTFTPTLNFEGVTTGITYGTQVGRYNIRGNRVFFDVNIVLTSKGAAAGIAYISGLPCAVLNVAGHRPAFSVSFSDLTFSGQVSAVSTNNSTQIVLSQSASGGAVSSITNTDIANTTQLVVSGSYEIANLPA